VCRTPTASDWSLPSTGSGQVSDQFKRRGIGLGLRTTLTVAAFSHAHRLHFRAELALVHFLAEVREFRGRLAASAALWLSHTAVSPLLEQMYY
jgi:hypothetical protein